MLRRIDEVFSHSAKIQVCKNAVTTPHLTAILGGWIPAIKWQ